MKSLAMVLIIIGIVALVYGAVDYNDSRTTIEVGSMSASITENGTRPIVAIIAGGIALIGGLMLYSSERRRA